MNTYAIIGLLMLGGMMLAQFFFPTMLSGIASGLSYGSVKAVLETWAANRKQRKEDRQKKRAERGGLFGRRRRRNQVEPTPTPETKPIPPAEKNAMAALGFDRYIEAPKPTVLDAIADNPYDAGSPRANRILERLEERQARRARRRNGRRG